VTQPWPVQITALTPAPPGGAGVGRPVESPAGNYFRQSTACVVNGGI
jgi:hypothetical protein